jgi:Ion channel
MRAAGESQMARESVLFRRRLNDQLSIVLTILLSVLLFAVAPMQADRVVSGRVSGLLFGMALVPAAFMVSGNKTAVGAIVVAMGLVVAAAILEFRESRADKYLDAAAWLIAGLTLSTVVARAVFGPGRINYHRIVGGVLLYLTIGLTFVALFAFIVLLVPNAFNNPRPVQGNFAISNLIYFSFVTLTTMGYGDVVPLHPYARGPANVEAIIGQLYPATLLARLVTLELAKRSG